MVRNIYIYIYILTDIMGRNIEILSLRTAPMNKQYGQNGAHTGRVPHCLIN